MGRGVNPHPFDETLELKRKLGVAKGRPPALDAGQQQRVINTLTPGRMTKYLRAANNDPYRVIRLYINNSKVSAAYFNDLHFLEVVLRNKFHEELTAVYGPAWYTAPAFLGLMNKRTTDILAKVQRDLVKRWPVGQSLPPGKVVAELTFGFWLSLTDRALEHALWVPCLHKAFLPRKAPKRSVLNDDLEKLRQLRNRIAHHEPIFHMDLMGLHRILRDVTTLLCPDVAHVMISTSTARREVHALLDYRRRKKI